MIHWTISYCLLGLGVLGTDQPIDTFDYANTAAAQQQWHAVAERGEETPLHVVRDDDRNVVEMALPFASQPKISRVYMDRNVKLNLAGAGELVLEVLNTVPEAGGRLSLYFRSGKGWYSAGTELAGKDWQTLRFSKADFSIEGTPVGWHKVDGIRIGVWRGQEHNSSLRLRRLETVEHDVALVIPSSNSKGDVKSALKSASEVAAMLTELGLGSDAIEDTAISRGALGKRRVAILAHNSSLSEESTAALAQFVERGGKLLVCYQLPSELSAVLGFSQLEYHRPDNEGTLAEVRFEAKDIEGLPASMRQASWNITTAKPAGFNARVIGWWYAGDGKATHWPAMLLSDRGAFFSHVILQDDREKKKQMLAAVLGHLAPPLWQQMATNALDRAGQVGHLSDSKQLVNFLKKSSNKEVASLLESAQKTFRQARQKRADKQYAEVVQLAGQLRATLVRAYMVAQPSKTVEGRAFWNHSGTGAYDGDWERTARELSKAGFNMIIPNMLWGGRAHYASDVLPRSRTYKKYGDQITQCVKAAHKHGLQVHVWKVNWNLSGAPAEFVKKIHREHRNQVSVDGKAHDWLCPSHPENFKLELASMLEVAKKYDVDGLHFDYIRYPGRDKCYCDGCRQRFQAQTGKHVAHWPEDCYNGPLRDQYADWRCAQITRLVKAVHDEAKKLRPEIEISAAVFSRYPSCRADVAQDWPEWIKAGYLDFVCPMDYTQTDPAFVSLVTNQLKLVGGRIPIYPGIGQWRLTDDRTVGQIHLARQLGADGFTIFNLNAESIETTVPAIGLGVGRQKAATPHRK